MKILEIVMYIDISWMVMKISLVPPFINLRFPLFSDIRQ